MSASNSASNAATPSNAPAPTTTNTLAQPSQPPLPPAHLFDILPPLHALLSRLEPSLNSYTAPTSAALDPSLPVSNLPSSTIGGSEGRGELSYKDVPTASQFLKARMRKAMAELGKLGDMDRTVEEQRQEMEELERKIDGQRAVLTRLGRLAGERSGIMKGEEEGEAMEG